MVDYLLKDLNSGTLSSNVLAGASTLPSASFATLPVVSAPDILWLTLDPEAVSGAPEIVKVTSHASSSTNVTVVRGQGGTTDRNHGSGTKVVAGLVKAVFDEIETEMGGLRTDLDADVADLLAHSADDDAHGSVTDLAAHVADNDGDAHVAATSSAAGFQSGAHWSKTERLGEGVELSRDSGQSVGNGTTAFVVWNQEVYDPANWHSNAEGNLINIPYTGFYLIEVKLGTSIAVSEAGFRLNSNTPGSGGTFFEFSNPEIDQMLTAFGTGLSEVRRLTAGDDLRVEITDDVGVGGGSTIGTGCRFLAVFLGP